MRRSSRPASRSCGSASTCRRFRRFASASARTARRFSDEEQRLWWRDAREEQDAAGVFGDLVLAAFFERRPNRRSARRCALSSPMPSCAARRTATEAGTRSCGTPSRRSLRSTGEIEFPEVFERDNSGFDAIVGNPPFVGTNTVAASNVACYPGWLKQVHAGSHGNADQVAHFFRRAFDLVRRDGAFGLIATNTIAQGDTRSTGLRWICTHGGEIHRARRRVPWPGLAVVVVSVLHVYKGPFTGVRCLDDAVTDLITAFLYPPGWPRPARLEENAGKSFLWRLRAQHELHVRRHGHEGARHRRGVLSRAERWKLFSRRSGFSTGGRAALRRTW